MNLHGGAVSGHGGEAHDVAEVDGDAVVQLRYHGFALSQLVSHTPVHRAALVSHAGDSWRGTR